MMRSFAVVLVFVVLNAAAFVAYRAISTSEAATSTRQDSAAAARDTLSRAIPARQPKPDAPATPPVVAPYTSDSSVSSPTKSTTIEPADATPPVTAHQTHRPPATHHHVERTPARAAKPAHAAPPAAVTAPAAQDKPAPAPPKADNKLLEMEANPYKQSE